MTYLDDEIVTGQLIIIFGLSGAVLGGVFGDALGDNNEHFYPTLYTELKQIDGEG